VITHEFAVLSAAYIAAFCIGQFIENLIFMGKFVQIFFFSFAQKLPQAISRLCAIGIKKILKLGFIYILYLAIVWAFDYFYMPWLAYRFGYFAMFPLYLSLFAVSWFGLFLYRFFRENIFFLEEIREWLARDSRFRILDFFKKKAYENPRLRYILISTVWSPLHSYLFFKHGDIDNAVEVAKSFAIGSLYCAFFWGVVIDIVILLWDLLKSVFWLLWGVIKL
jgi:hypothetical protein